MQFTWAFSFGCTCTCLRSLKDDGWITSSCKPLYAPEQGLRKLVLLLKMLKALRRKMRKSEGNLKARPLLTMPVQASWIGCQICYLNTRNYFSKPLEGIFGIKDECTIFAAGNQFLCSRSVTFGKYNHFAKLKLVPS